MRLIITFIIFFTFSCKDTETSSQQQTSTEESIFKTDCYDTSVVWIYRDEENNDTLFRLAITDDGKIKAKDGHWIIYFDKAFTKKVYEATIKNGQKVGLYTHWRRNGSKFYEGSGIGDIDTGYYRQWHPNGQLSREAYHRNDSIIGTTKYFYDNGKLKSETFYIRDNISKEVNYDKNGALKTMLLYKVPKTKDFTNFSKPVIELEFSSTGELLNAYKHYTDSSESKEKDVKVWFDRKISLDSLRK